jgi:hypothetical protein
MAVMSIRYDGVFPTDYVSRRCVGTGTGQLTAILFFKHCRSYSSYKNQRWYWLRCGIWGFSPVSHETFELGRIGSLPKFRQFGYSTYQ